MKIRLKLSGELEDYIRPELWSAYSVSDNASVEDVLAGFTFRERIALTSVNGKMIPAAERATTRLNAGDELMLLPPIKGG